jgi:hypothetical protein
MGGSISSSPQVSCEEARRRAAEASVRCPNVLCIGFEVFYQKWGAYAPLSREYRYEVFDNYRPLCLYNYTSIDEIVDEILRRLAEGKDFRDATAEQRWVESQRAHVYEAVSGLIAEMRAGLEESLSPENVTPEGLVPISPRAIEVTSRPRRYFWAALEALFDADVYCDYTDVEAMVAFLRACYPEALEIREPRAVCRAADREAQQLEESVRKIAQSVRHSEISLPLGRITREGAIELVPEKADFYTCLLELASNHLGYRIRYRYVVYTSFTEVNG